MNRKMRIVSIAASAALVCLLAVTGCASKSAAPAPAPSAPQSGSQGSAGSVPKGDLVGKWSISMGGKASSTSPSWEFTKDGKFIQSVPSAAPGTYQNVEGSYEYAGGELKLETPTAKGSATSTMPVDWVSADELKLGMSGASLTLTRKK